MDFGSAINSHVQWKAKLAKYIAKPDGSLNPAIVSSDQNCDLGKWLYGEGQEYRDLEGFSPLVAEHARFHEAAAEIVRRASAGDKVTQEIVLSAKSDFARASRAVVASLLQLKDQVSER